VNGPPVFARSTAALWRRVGDEVLLAAPDRSEIDRLSVPASAAWLLLERPQTRADLTEALAGKFEVVPTEIAEHVDRMVEELEARGWVVRAANDD
jgi:hypothetical protein